MDIAELHNVLLIMRSIDRGELEFVGIYLSHSEWLRFSHDPYDWFIKASSTDAARLWQIIVSRSRGGVR
jgi:hypothetical protein